MNIPVVDASVAAKWFIWEEGTEEAHELLDSINLFLVPGIFLAEIDAILTKKVRKKELPVREAFEKREQFRELPYQIISYRNISEFAFRLSTDFAVTLYDATYLALAVDHETVFYTADKRLVNGMSNTPFDEYMMQLRY